MTDPINLQAPAPAPESVPQTDPASLLVQAKTLLAQARDRITETQLQRDEMAEKLQAVTEGRDTLSSKYSALLEENGGLGTVVEEQKQIMIKMGQALEWWKSRHDRTNMIWLIVTVVGNIGWAAIAFYLYSL